MTTSPTPAAMGTTPPLPAGAGPVTVARRPGAAIVTFARPPVNVLDGATMAALERALGELGREASVVDVAADRAINLIVMRGAGRCFSAGADVGEHLPPGVGDMLAGLRRLVVTLAELPVPTLAAAHGFVLGGGLEVALAADRRIVTADARLGNPEIQLGVIAPAAAVLLPPLVGPARALAILAPGKDMGADEALRIGLVDRVVASDGLEAAIDEEIAAMAGLAHHAVLATKEAVAAGHGAGPSLDQRLRAAEAVYLERIAQAPASVAALRSFMERKKK